MHPSFKVQTASLLAGYLEPGLEPRRLILSCNFGEKICFGFYLISLKKNFNFSPKMEEKHSETNLERKAWVRGYLQP